MSESTIKWRGSIVATVALATAGVLQGSASLLLAATLPLGYGAYVATSTATVPDELRTERSIEPELAPPGRPITITVRVRNDSAETLADVRVVDQVPSELAVLDGSPRGGRPLGPEETLTIEYTVIARRGEFDFAPPRVRVRGTSAGAYATAERVPDGDTRLTCRLDADAPPLSDRGNGRVGQFSTDDPGSGHTFHSTRQYRHGDPAARIDWRGYAKRGTLSTVNYEKWMTRSVIFVVDVRVPARVAAGPGRPTAVELGAYATTHALSSLLEAGNDIGVAIVGQNGDGPAGLQWLRPDSGHDQRAQAIGMLTAATESDDSDLATKAAAGRQFRKLVELAEPRTQLVLVSPLVDEQPVEALETWAAWGYPRTVLSPDIVASNTVSGQYEHVRRRTRLARSQRTGARTIDWRRGTPLPIIITEAFLDEARRPTDTMVAGGDR